MRLEFITTKMIQQTPLQEMFEEMTFNSEAQPLRMDLLERIEDDEDEEEYIRVYQGS